MDNQELKIKFEENKVEIEKARTLNQDVTALLKTKYDLLKLGFEEIKAVTSDEKFNQNPKKYSTLLSYINNMKQVAQEINLPLSEVESIENQIKKAMENNNLGWLLNK